MIYIYVCVKDWLKNKKKKFSFDNNIAMISYYKILHISINASYIDNIIRIKR